MEMRAIRIVVVLMASLLIALPGFAQTKLVIGLPGTVTSPDIIEAFKRDHPHIEVEEMQMAWGDFFEKLPAMLAGGVAPDVWYGEAGRSLGWRHNGIVADLTRFVERDLNLDDYFFLDAARDPRTGEWTGIPSDFQVSALFYNTSHLPAQGLAYPDGSWTTDDLVEAAQKLTIPGPECPLQYGLGLQQSYITVGWMLWPRLLGAPILSEDRTESRMNDPRTIDALDFMRSLLHEKRIAPAPGSGCGGYSMAGNTISLEFYLYSRVLTFKNSGFDTYDVAPIPMSPTGKRFTTAVPNVWVINETASDDAKEAAWEWVKFQIGEEAQLIRMMDGAGVLVNRNVSPSFLSEPGPPENRAVFLDSYAFADTLEENAAWSEYRVALQSALSPLWNGTASAQQVALDAHQRVSAILSEVYGKE